LEDHKILKNKNYLYATEFFSGMSVMAVELGASRLLAPYFSSSQIVWTIIIGTIMIAMALGNIWGGRSADKDPDPGKLYRRIIIAAVWIAAIPVCGKYVILLISGLLILTVSTNFLIIAAFLACMILFVFPLLLLGTVTPSLAKYATESLSDNGRTVGTLGAFQTVGSIIGTFVPTFFTIPAVGTSVTFLIFSGILLLLGLIYFISTGTGRKASVACTVIFLICLVLGRSDSFAFWEKNLLYEGESVYNYLQVKDEEDAVTLSTNVLFGVQSIMMKHGSWTGMYYDYALAAPAASDGAAGPLKILILGNGTGTYARQCRTYFPDATVKGVEIDQKITDLAGRYFAYPDDIETVTYDGRAYLNASKEKFDVILVDAYQDITIPFQMSSREFFTLVRDHLNENGIMAVNMNMHSDGEGSINEYLSDTISSVFANVCTVDVPNTTNRELFAGKKPADTVKSSLEHGIRLLKNGELVRPMQAVAGEMKEYRSGNKVLTDDRAPVELLGMKAIDALIRDEVGYYRDSFRENGIKSLLN